MFMKQQIKDLIQRVDALEHELALLCGRVKKIERETPSNLPLYGEALQTSRTNYSKRTLLGECRAAEPSSSPLGEVRRGLLLLMECKAPDGHYLVTRKVHWQAVYRVMVDGGWYDASLGYAGFVDYIRSVAPPGGFRIMPDVETIRHISQTLYARPFRDWRYDAAYGTKRWTYERMRAVAEVLQSCLGEEKMAAKRLPCHK